MNQPVVSVILPFYNAEQTLERAVQSILSQSFQDLELILVDNNSSDESPRIAGRFCNLDQRATCLEEPDKGIVHALNKGLSVARGKYIARMDADDWSHPERLEKQCQFLDYHPGVDLVSCRAKLIGQENHCKGMELFVDRVNNLIDHEEMSLYRFVESPLIHPTVMFRKQLVELHGKYRDGDFPEDYELWLRWFQHGVQFHKLEELLFHWHDLPGRLTRTDQRYAGGAFFNVKAKYLYNWSEKHNPSHPGIAVWGGGRLAKKKTALLLKKGFNIQGIIDVDKRKCSMPGGIFYKDLPPPGGLFIISLTTNRGAGKKIEEFLLGRKYKNGEDFLLCG